LDKNSMLYWFPLTELTNILKPKTIIIWTGIYPLMNMLDGKPLPNHIKNFILAGARELGYPLFLRTDLASGKHSWKDACYVPSEDVLFQHIFRVVEENDMAGFLGLNYQAIVLRQFIPLEHSFTAFWGRMPVSKERRYFIRDGKVECHHPYWAEDAIATSDWPEEELIKVYNLPNNWRSLLTTLNHETEEEIELLTGYAEQLGKYLSGYWSLDFAKGQDGNWYFIDAALGEQSWHPVHREK
jgi:hypothetical protein